MDAPKIPYHNIQGCVFKLFWGERYVIVKCKMFARAKTIIEQSLKYHLKTGMHDKLYEKFFSYIKSTPFHSFQVEILLESNNPYQLLKKEQSELDLCKTDINCMNTSFEAYVPQFTQVNGVGSWINRGYYLNFCIWRKKVRPNQNTIV